MSAPRRLIDDPTADAGLREVLANGSGARPLEEKTKRRLAAKLSRAAALPAVAAWWLFVKSAVAALGMVGAVATAATLSGVLEWRSDRSSQRPASSSAPRAFAVPSQAPRAPAPSEREPAFDAGPPLKLNPVPSLPQPSPPSSAASLAIESALLEQARREMRRAPDVALQIAREHTQRYPRGQLAAERTLLQLEALHRLGRDGEARALGRGLLGGSAGQVYRERARQLLGESSGH